MAYKYKRKKEWKLPKLKDSWRSDRKLIKFIAFALLFIIIGAGISTLISTYLPEAELNILYILALPELLTTDYTQVSVDADVVNGIGVVVLTGGCKQIIANTEAGQAESIAFGLVENFGIKVNMLKIVEVRNGTFIGRFVLQKGKNIVSLDVRPSDGTAIAVRVGAPIYVKDSLLEEFGEDIC